MMSEDVYILHFVSSKQLISSWHKNIFCVNLFKEGGFDNRKFGRKVSKVCPLIVPHRN